MRDNVTSNNTIAVLESKKFGLNKLYRLIIDKDRIYGVYLSNQLTGFDSLGRVVDFVLYILVLNVFNTLFISSPLDTTWELAKYIFIFIIFILAGIQLSNYLGQFLRPYLSKIEKSKLDKYQQIIAHSLTLIDTPDLFLQQNKHNFVLERKEVLGVEINDKYDYWAYPETQYGQIIITAKNLTKKLLIKEIYPSEVREIFKNQGWNEF